MSSVAGYPGNTSDFRFSPRSHRADTIHWRTWGEEAFQEAVQQDKPLFLVISSSWCEWCHIMDETTLSEPTVITILNKDFIPIRVDSDMRPDVNARYNQKGWPSVALLSAEGELLWGGVYVPPKQMLYYLGHIRRYYSEHRQEIVDQASLVQNERTTRSLTHTLPALTPSMSEEPVSFVDVPGEAGKVLQDLYDGEHGGFTLHPHLKFPHPEALEFLLLLSKSENCTASEVDTLRDMVSYSLEQMCEGGLWDKDAGGFFRYSAASDWSAPHTEKMLEENAALLRLTLLTASITQEQRWYDLAQRLVLYINTHLWMSEPGIFAGSQSADEAYYEPCLYSHTSAEAPPVDTTVYTSWNAQMISSYLLAAKVLDRPSLDTIALNALNWLCQHMISPTGSAYHYAAYNQGELASQLTDQVWMIRALLDAYEYHGNKAYLELAQTLTNSCYEELFDEQHGLFYDIPYDSQAVGRLAMRTQPLTENALVAENLLHMANITGNQEMCEKGQLVLSRCLEQYRRTGIQGATYALVVLQSIGRDQL
jgi:uncharacterized protein YyaL (SSP411 family)